MSEQKSSRLGLVVLIAFLLTLAVGFVLVHRAYQAEGALRTLDFNAGTDPDPTHMEVNVKVVSVDPVKGEMTARLDFVPHGDLTKDDGRTLARNLKLTVNSATGKGEHEFAKGKKMNPFDLVLGIYDGQVMDFPFDTHKAEFYLDFEADAAGDKKSEAAKPAADAPAAASDDEEEDDSIEMDVNFTASLVGMSIKAAVQPDSSSDDMGIDIEVSRAPTVLFFSSFVMLAMWLLVFAVLRLLWSVSFGERKIEVGMFSFLGSMLFAFPALRNSQPGVPPIGTYGDFISFFWAEGLIALALLSIVMVWLARPTGK